MTKGFKGLIYDFFTHPMRIFFLYAGFLGICATFILLFGVGDFIALHQFIFMRLFVGAAFAGFLFSALPDWTHYKKSLLPFSISSFVLLNLALITEICYGNSVVLLFLFWILLFLSSCLWIYLDKNYNHFSILFVLACITFCYGFEMLISSPIQYALLHCYVAGIIIVGFRVSAVLAQLALKVNTKSQCVFLPNPILRNLSYLAVLLLALCELLDVSLMLRAFIALGVGFILFGRIYEWHYRIFFGQHYTLIYYFLLLGSGILYILLGYCYLFDSGFRIAILHGIMIWVLIGFIFLIFNVASLRHSGQLVLKFPLSSKIGFLFLALAALSRMALWQIWNGFYILIPSLLLGILLLWFLKDFFMLYKNNDFSEDPK